MILNKNSFCQVADEKKHARPFAGIARYQYASRQLLYRLFLVRLPHFFITPLREGCFFGNRRRLPQKWQIRNR